MDSEVIGVYLGRGVSVSDPSKVTRIPSAAELAAMAGECFNCYYRETHPWEFPCDSCLVSSGCRALWTPKCGAVMIYEEDKNF